MSSRDHFDSALTIDIILHPTLWWAAQPSTSSTVAIIRQSILVNEEVKPSPAEFSHIIHEKQVMSKDAAGVPTKLAKTVSGAAILPL